MNSLTPFSKDEDDKISFLVSTYGDSDFSKISAHLPGRSSRDVRDRYLNYLCSKDPKIPWTHQEDNLLIDMVREHGRKWKKLIGLFPKRSIIDLKIRFMDLQSYNREVTTMEEELPYITDKPQESNECFIDQCIHELQNILDMDSNPQQRIEGTAFPYPSPSHQLSIGQSECHQDGKFYKGELYGNEQIKICIPAVINGYHFHEQIGNGSFSSVAKVTKDGCTFQYSAKIIPMKLLRNTPMERQIYNEANIALNLDHTNIIKCYEYFETPDGEYMIIIYEYCERSLLDYILEGDGTPEEKKAIARGIVDGIHYLHSRCISHSDIKPENIMLVGMTPKIIDFGFAKYHPDSPIDIIPPYTLCYAGPEVFSNSMIDVFKLDIHEFGMTLYTLAMGSSFFSDVNDKELVKYQIINIKFPIDKNDGLQILAAKCTRKDPNKRPSIEKIRNYEFFNF